MADKAIPGLTDGGAPQAGDAVHVVRDGNSRKAALGSAAGAATTDFATAAQGSLADTALQPTAIGSSVQGYDAQLFSNIPQNSQSAAYTLVLSDAQKHIYHPSSDTTGRTWTIPANSSVAFPIGTAVTFINEVGAGEITIVITSDTLVLAGDGGTGSRTLAAGGMATAVKTTSTRWMISGAGLS